MYIPLRKYERVETAVVLFGHLLVPLKIPNSCTAVSCSKAVLENILSKKQEYAALMRMTSGGKHLENEIYFGSLGNKICSILEELSSEKSRLDKLVEKKEEKISEVRSRKREYDDDITSINDSINILRSNIKIKESQINTYINEYRRSYTLPLQTRNIYIFDDFLCTGSSVDEFLRKNSTIIKSLVDVKIHFLFLEATEIGISKITNTIKELTLDNVQFSYGKISLNIDEEVANEFPIEILNREEHRLNEEFNLPKGSYECRTAIATYINAPNSNYNFLNCRGHGWQPLFERENRVSEKINLENLNEVVKVY